jgi:hypothetical protein
MSEKEYIKQLEDANYVLQQRVDELQLSNDNLTLALRKYTIHMKNFSKTQWHVCLGNAVIGDVKFGDDNLYRVRLQVVIPGNDTEKFSSLVECREFIINRITERKGEDSKWKLTI